MEKDKLVSEDEMASTLKKIDEMSDAFIEKAAEIGRAKEKEIREL